MYHTSIRYYTITHDTMSYNFVGGMTEEFHATGYKYHHFEQTGV